MSRLAQDMKKLAHRAGGSHKTVHDREQMAQRFAHHLLAQNIQIIRTDHIKARHITGYINERLAQGISPRTLQNEMAMVRSILAEAGRTQLSQSELISNQSLGINGACRDGTHRAIPDAFYQQVLERVRQTDAGLAASLQLARVMGLRGQEAVQCCQSLKTWDKLLEKGTERLPVIFGTKGGRPRMTQVMDREAVRQAVKEALNIAVERNGHLIDKSDLKSAMDYWHNHLRDAGLTGEYAPHSLRYAWAQDAIRYYEEQGLSHKEVLAVTSTDLGHGDGRGRYIEQVYGQTD
ncbi:integrase domain-containing protein [Kluyvera ascorbata]|uniref:integrase domain-containing protein n=1 Tax=Kluyvera ascorbata TaxID=51288 RepID=UPI0035CCC926